MAYRYLPRTLVGVPALSVAIAGLACPAQAASPGVPGAPRLEIWSGGEAFEGGRSAYSGATWAPFGGVREDGLRVRAALGAGAYRGGGIAFGDVLIGYHRQLGPVTFKIFAGVTVADYYPADTTSMLEGAALGPKAVLETWWTLTDRAWASADLSFALPHMYMQMHRGGQGNGLDRVDYSGRVRLGWRLWPELSVGLEGGAGGPLAPTLPSTLQSTLQHGIARAGGFLRYEWAGGEVSLSGGILVDGDEREGQTRPFGTVSVLTRF
jgi:hypothetical protein